MKPPQRLHFLDALRVMAMTAVIALHACISYMTLRLPDLAWLVYDKATSPFFDRLFLWVQGFAMPVFFLVSGFCAALLYGVLGLRRFLNRRAGRLFLPFLACLLLLLPAVYYLWGYGWFLSGKCELREVVAGKFFDPKIRRDLYGPAHLWFLEYLLIFTGVFGAARAWIQRRGSARTPERTANSGFSRFLFNSGLRPIFFFIPTALILYLDPGAMFNFRNSFVPGPARLLHYAVFFIFGVWLYSFRDELDELSGPAPFYLLFSIPAFALAEISFKIYQAGAADAGARAALAVFAGLFTWLFIFGLLGSFKRSFNDENKAMRYLSNASYWVYLIHFPLVGLAQVFFLPFSWPAQVKFLAVFSFAAGISLLSYDLIVVRTLNPVFAENVMIPDARTVLKAKVRLSALVVLLIVFLGSIHQYFYDRETSRYREEITKYYRLYFHREPDQQGLDYWTMMGVNKYGLKRVEQEGFIDAKNKGAQ